MDVRVAIQNPRVVHDRLDFDAAVTVDGQASRHQGTVPTGEAEITVDYMDRSAFQAALGGPLARRLDERFSAPAREPVAVHLELPSPADASFWVPWERMRHERGPLTLESNVRFSVSLGPPPPAPALPTAVPGVLFHADRPSVAPARAAELRSLAGWQAAQIATADAPAAPQPAAVHLVWHGSTESAVQALGPLLTSADLRLLVLESSDAWELGARLHAHAASLLLLFPGTARAFREGLYEALARGADLATAVSEARPRDPLSGSLIRLLGAPETRLFPPRGDAPALEALPLLPTAVVHAPAGLEAFVLGAPRGAVEDLDSLWGSLDPPRATLLRLEAALADATQENAPVATARRAFRDAKAAYEAADQALRRRAGDAGAASDRFLEAAKGLPALLAAVDAAVASARGIRRRADLILLQSLTAVGDHRYEALLRAASVPGVHGLSLHGTSTLITEDRHRVTRAMAEITRLVRQGALRAAARGFAAFGSEADQPPPNVDLARSGADLHALFLPPTVTDYLARERCSLTLTTNDLELPWELLHDGREFLCLDRPVARMPMGQLLPDLSRRARPAPGPLRFLLVRPDPALGFAEAEIEALRARLQGRAEVDVLGPDEAGVDEVHDALTGGRHHVIHYAGHARFDADQPARSALLLRGGRPLYAEHVQRSLRGAPLVFLNACESAASAQDAADERASPLQVLTAGLASAFVYGGALGCVGAIWPVYDDGAAFLAGELYASLLEGTMVGEAMRQARVATRARFPLQLTWAAFVLYGDPTFQLVT